MEEKSVLQLDADLTFPHLFVLDASAGSGKTHNLALRFIQFLLSDRIRNDHARTTLDSLLAITFTNKAANEMKERILRQIKRLALGDRAALTDACSVISMDPDALQTAAYGLVDQMIRRYTDFQVRTIDSFLRSIMVASLRETRLQPDFEIVMDPVPFIEFAVDDLLAKIQTDQGIRELLLRFLDTYLLVEDKTSFYPRTDIIKTVNSLRSRENKMGKPLGSAGTEPGVLNVKKEHLQASVIDLYALIERHGIMRNRQKMPDKDILLGKISNNDFTNTLWTKPDAGYLLTKQSLNREGALQGLWNTIREQLADLLVASDGSRYSSYRDILSAIMKTLEDQSLIRGEILVDDINKYVRGLIDACSVPELYFNLGENIVHYFIDEFQDTDRAQWNNIRALVIEALANGGSLFYVGDKKQSLYRFKGSDASLFDEVPDDLEIQAILRQTYRKNLSSNYRSDPVLVSFFNETFRPEVLKGLGTGHNGAVSANIEAYLGHLIDAVYTGSLQTEQPLMSPRASGHLLIEYVPAVDDSAPAVDEQADRTGDQGSPDDGDAEIRRIAGIIKDLHDSGSAYSDIALLVRTNKEAKALSGTLKQNSIPVQSAQGFDIREHSLIRETISFLMFINNPQDALSFAGFVSGELFLACTGIQPDAVNDWLLRQQGNRNLSVAFRQWQPGLWDDLIRPLLNGVGYLPAYDIVHEFARKLRVRENFAGAVGFFMHLLGMLKQREAQGETNLDSFLEYWTQRPEEDAAFFIRLSSGDAVNVLTIHKSKGLEYPVVILPSASLTPPKNSTPDMLVLETGDSLTLTSTSPAHRDILASINPADPSVEAFIKERALSILDELNVFYVAVTRARQDLSIFIRDRKDPLYTLFGEKLGPAGKYEEGTRPAARPRQQAEEVFPDKPPVSTRWQNHIFIKQPDRDSLEHYNEEKRGDIFHALLAQIQVGNPGEKIAEFFSAVTDERTRNQAGALDAAVATLSLQDVQSWFHPGPSTVVFTEKDVVNEKGETKRIDRLVVSPDEAIVIDYKTGGHGDRESHKQQVREYMNIITGMYPSRHTRGFLVYLDLRTIEEVG